MLFLIIIFLIKKEDNIFNNNTPLIMKQLIKRSKRSNNLITKRQYPKNEILLIEKNELLKYISNLVGQKITRVNSIYFGSNRRFGNKMKIINNIIFYCQILGCKRIFLDKGNIWFLKNKIINKKYKIIIIPEEINHIKHYKTIIDRTSNFFYYSLYLRPQKRIDLLKNEILRNLPKVSTNQKDLYIYMRSGDIFIRPHHFYTQPPLCFYTKILDNYIYRNYYLIAENKNNPVINKLLETCPNIIYNRNKLHIDIAYLTNSYNLVAGRITTFLDAIIPINNNLKNIWIFKLQYQNESNRKIFNHFYSIKGNIYEMISSEIYFKNMKSWSNNKFQRDMMINSTCINEFKSFLNNLD